MRKRECGARLGERVREKECVWNESMGSMPLGFSVPIPRFSNSLVVLSQYFTDFRKRVVESERVSERCKWWCESESELGVGFSWVFHKERARVRVSERESVAGERVTAALAFFPSLPFSNSWHLSVFHSGK